MTEKEETEKSARSGWVVFGFAATAVYFTALGSILGNSGPDSLLPINKASLALNTFGDFVAGICAPLAFLWLFVATMVQSQELALQRQELRLTRREFELNRDILKQQAEEARAQAAFIGKQTQLLEGAEVDRLIDTHQAAFIRRYRKVGGRTIMVGEADDEDRQMIQIGVQSSDPLNFVGAATDVRVIASQLRRAKNKSPDKVAYFSKPHFQPLGDALNEIAEMMDRSSPTMKAKLKEANFATAVAAADYLLAQCVDYPKNLKLNDRL
ncbi:hypothetical protein NKH80_11270 [Mesorhizobium sp. M0904]|uniref:hypothetical protein n=1 Tax=unclassified Mesorhizobium TaxID=325217 RepID=UPI00333CA6DC